MTCKAHRIIVIAAIITWLLVIVMIVDSPAPEASLRLPFFAVLGVAVALLMLALLPWLLVGLTPVLFGPLEPKLRTQVGMFLAGWASHEGDVVDPEDGPGLQLLQGGAR